MLNLKKINKVAISLVTLLGVSPLAYADNGLGKTSYISYFFSIILLIAIFIGVVFLALYSTKFIAQKTNNLGNNRNIKIVDFINLSRETRIVTVKIYNKLYILSVNNNSTTVIDELKEEDLGVEFSELLQKNMEFRNDKYLNYNIVDLKNKISKAIKKSPNDKE